MVRRSGSKSGSRTRRSTLTPMPRMRAILPLEFPDLDFVGIEGEKAGDRLHFVVGRFVAPCGVLRTALERVVRGVALEGTVRLVARSLEAVHLHVAAREVINRRICALLH